MTTISYKTSIRGRLEDEFAQGFQSMSVESLPHGRPVAVFLWRPDGTGLKIQSVMHDLAERFEVGSLEFSHVIRHESKARIFDLPREFCTGLKAAKLLLSIEPVTVEAGILLKDARGNEIIVCAGAQPYTLAVQASFALDIVGTFEPEYELSVYSQEAM